jgi:formiminotetrahydrofolate cyclodeaminase
MKDIENLTVQNYLDELASKNATPGGGSAAALMGAQAAALVSMVCNLTLGKPKYAEVESQIQALLTEAESLRATLITMIKADIAVFDKLMACYALPKNQEAEKTFRSEQIQAALKEATQVPLECAKACAKAISLSAIAAEKGSLAVISDAGVAVVSAHAGLKSAALNVQINAASLKDNMFAEQKLLELQQILEQAEIETQAVYALVKSKL